jgi:DNA polymerase-1
MMDALLYGDRAIMVSGDKDLNITPGPLWIADEGRIDYIQDRFGWIKLKQTTNGNKVVGHGTKFFWAQMLMGDTADNVQGIIRLNGKLCGAVGAYNALEGITSESDVAEFVIRAYLAAKQNPLAEAECLWLRRSLDDTGYAYLRELGLPDYLQQWLDSLHQYHQEVLEFKLKARQEEQYDEDEQTSTPSSPRTEVHGSSNRHDGCDVPWEGGCDSGCRGCNAPA